MNNLVVTVTTTDKNRHARAVFTWSSDGNECEVSAFGFSDKELNKLMRAKAHEGVSAPGVVVASSR